MTRFWGLLSVSLCAGINVVMFPPIAVSQQPYSITGLWALPNANRDWCKEYLSGKLDNLPAAVASNSGLVKISYQSMEWIYSAASCQLEKLDAGPHRYAARAQCEFKGTQYNNNVTFVLRGANRMLMKFSNSNCPFSATHNYKRCTK
jgi:hypothetical protein